MKRRPLLLAGLAAGIARRSAGQRPPPRIGVLVFGAPSAAREADPTGPLRDGLRDLGWIEGQNLVVEWRFAEGRPERLPALAAELVRLDVALIVGAGPAPVKAALAATRTLPIVAVGSPDPVGEGWAQSLARPGGNVTGLSATFPELGPKRLEILKEAVPGMKRVAVVLAPDEVLKGSDETLRASGQALGLELRWLEVRAAPDFDAALGGARRAGTQGLLAIGTNLIVDHRRRLAELALREQLPSISDFPLMAQAGLLLSYGADLYALMRGAARYVDRILAGQRPGELAIERPTRFECVVNLGTARALGLTLPAATMRRADRVIE